MESILKRAISEIDAGKNQLHRNSLSQIAAKAFEIYIHAPHDFIQVEKLFENETEWQKLVSDFGGIVYFIDTTSVAKVKSWLKLRLNKEGIGQFNQVVANLNLCQNIEFSAGSLPYSELNNNKGLRESQLAIASSILILSGACLADNRSSNAIEGIIEKLSLDIGEMRKRLEKTNSHSLSIVREEPAVYGNAIGSSQRKSSKAPEGQSGHQKLIRELEGNFLDMERRRAIREVYNKVGDWLEGGNTQKVNQLFGEYSKNRKPSLDLLMAFLTISSNWRDELPNRKALEESAKHVAKETYGEQRARNILAGLVGE